MHCIIVGACVSACVYIFHSQEADVHYTPQVHPVLQNVTSLYISWFARWAKLHAIYYIDQHQLSKHSCMCMPLSLPCPWMQEAMRCMHGQTLHEVSLHACMHAYIQASHACMASIFMHTCLSVLLTIQILV